MGYLLLVVVAIAFAALLFIHFLGRNLKSAAKISAASSSGPQALTESDTQNPNEVIANMILHVLDEHPDRQGLRHRLIEIYFDSGKTEEFLRHANLYKQHSQADDTEQWAQIREMGQSLIPEHPLFSESATQNKPTEPPRKRFGDAPEARSELLELADEYSILRNNIDFITRLDLALVKLTSRPTALQYAEKLSTELGGAQIYLKREDQTGSLPRLSLHLMGQAYIASEMGKKRILFGADNGEQAIMATQAAIRCGLQASVYIDAKKGLYTAEHRKMLQRLNADLLEAENIETPARELALQAWLKHPKENFLMLNLAAGPHPYPDMAADLQTTIGRECLRQIQNKAAFNLKAIVSRGAGTVDAIGLVESFLQHEDVALVMTTDTAGEQFSDHKREYPSLEREHAWLEATGRLQTSAVSSKAATEALELLARTEGLLPHDDLGIPLAAAFEQAKLLSKQEAVIVVIS